MTAQIAGIISYMVDSVKTIAALASGAGGAISLIRLSGPDAIPLAERVWKGRKPLSCVRNRQLQFGRLSDSNHAQMDQCLAVVFREPNSYTGEDLVELHCHGGGFVARRVLNQLTEVGCSPAEPGEFTRRAFINGKLDLTQAEAVNDLIHASSDMALHLANNQLEGALGNRIQQLRDQLTFQLSEFESQLDFPEEELDFQPADQVQESLNSVAMALRQLLETQNEGEVLREGVRLVLAGAPNTGKSSLLNTILGRDRAIVTEIPGTTRDLLEETASIRGIPVKLIDTAGIRESIDLVERTGIERTWQSVATAQLVLWLIDVSRPITEQLPPKHPEGSPILLVANKTDLLAAPLASDALQHNVCDDAALVSIRENDGMDTLFDKIEQLIWHTAHHSEPEIAVNTRHASLLKEALLSVDETIAELESGELELVCIPLRHAIDSLGAITGETVALDILDTIFSRFCIGK